ncbi:hypothetical protein DFH06DRAFT_1252237 [Mycena polygramma]|nr:hypothetical protein DFH06DRAFT_1252237 [Mycena polygramma]
MCTSFPTLPIHFAVDVDHSYWFCTTRDTSTAVFPLPCRHRTVPGRCLCLQIRLLLFTSDVYLAAVSEYLTSYISRATPCASISTVLSCVFCRSSLSTTWSRARSSGHVVLCSASIYRCRQSGKQTGRARAESQDVTGFQMSYRIVCMHHRSEALPITTDRVGWMSSRRSDWLSGVYYWWT